MQVQITNIFSIIDLLFHVRTASYGAMPGVQTRVSDDYYPKYVAKAYIVIFSEDY